MSYEAISIRLTPEEYQKVKELKKKNISQPAIFRRGLDEIIQDESKELTQNNNA